MKLWRPSVDSLRSSVAFVQKSLLGRDEPTLDERLPTIARRELSDGAWFDYMRGFVCGHETVFDVLARTTTWRQVREQMYDRDVDVPRLVASLPDDGPGHPLIPRIQACLLQRYGEPFTRVSLALYRDGRDSVAWHGDTVAREMDAALVATVSLGEPRRFLLRPTGGGVSVGFALGWGDLLVMGGSAQRTWQHAVPKVAHADPRLAVMFRPSWAASRPVSAR
jgi:alkylated DNA repair dioxygenase AlkB